MNNRLEALKQGLENIETQRKIAEAFKGFSTGDFRRFLREYHFEKVARAEPSEVFYYETAKEFARWISAFEDFADAVFFDLDGQECCPKYAMNVEGYLVDVQRSEMLVIAGLRFDEIYDWCADICGGDFYDFKNFMANRK